MRRRRGFALLTALWLLVALTSVGMEFAVSARDRRTAVINELDALVAGEAARSGLSRALASLNPSRAASADTGQPQTAIARPHVLDPWRDRSLDQIRTALADTVVLGNARYRVITRDPATAVNLNLATEDELRCLFDGLRIDAGRSDELAQAIADWRDADDSPRARGAERDDYVALGARELPANRPFRRVADLIDVRGMSQALYDSVAPYLTTVGSGRVNLETAPQPVLLTLPGIGDEAADAILRLRIRWRGAPSIQDIMNGLSSSAREALVPVIPELEKRVVFGTRELELTSEGWVENSRVHVVLSALLVQSTSGWNVSRAVIE
jgi:type II secretory pathway component PulK